MLKNYKFIQRRSFIYGVSAVEEATLFSGCDIAGINRLTWPGCQKL
jgi:hypothetical protein